jgi:nitrate reductase alpha subunit
MSFDELAAKGIVRVEDSEGVVYGDNAPYATMKQYVVHKKHYETHTGRQQHYHDHDWYIKYDETLPGHKDPLELEGYPLRMLMGHARHSIHSTWRDDTFYGAYNEVSLIYMSIPMMHKTEALPMVI